MMLEVNGRNVNSFNIHGGQLVVSLDESKDKLVERLMSLCGGVDLDSMHSGNLSDNDWESISNPPTITSNDSYEF